MNFLCLHFPLIFHKNNVIFIPNIILNISKKISYAVIFLNLLTPYPGNLAPELPHELSTIIATSDHATSDELMKSYLKQVDCKIPSLPNLKEKPKESIFNKEELFIICPLKQHNAAFSLDNIRLLLSADDCTGFFEYDNYGSTLSGILTDNRAFFIKQKTEHTGIKHCKCNMSTTFLDSQKLFMGDGAISNSWHDLMYDLTEPQLVSVYKQTGWSDDEHQNIESILHILPFSKIGEDVPHEENSNSKESRQCPETMKELKSQLLMESQEREKLPGKIYIVDDIKLLRSFLSVAITFKPSTYSDSLEWLEPLIEEYRTPRTTDVKAQPPPKRKRRKTQ